MRNESTASRVFDVFNVILMIILACVFLYPILYIVALSFSDASAIVSGKVYLFPVNFNISAYQMLFKDDSIIRSVLFTVQLTVSGVFSSLLMTVLAAYPLSRSHLQGSRIIMRLIVFTMYFSGGIIPTYMIIRGMGLFNSIWSLILPSVIDTFLLIIMINSFQTIPVELEEAAKVEGCSNFGVFRRIFLPLSTAVIATQIVFYSVAYWNTFFNALLYIQDPKRLTLQVKLYQVLNMFSDSLSDAAGSGNVKVIPENLKGATVCIAVLPIVCVYPFMQKYFVKGVTVGAVKG